MDKLATNELETAPADFGKLSDLVKNEVATKNEYNELVKKVNAIQTIDIGDLDKKKLSTTQKLITSKRK